MVQIHTHRIHGTRGHGKAISIFCWKINGGKEMVDVRLVTGVMSGSGVRKDQRVVDRTLESKKLNGKSLRSPRRKRAEMAENQIKSNTVSAE
jgi:hypothetical protein